MGRERSSKVCREGPPRWGQTLDRSLGRELAPGREAHTAFLGPSGRKRHPIWREAVFEDRELWLL